MTTSGPRYHIPFPRTFLSLNTPLSKPNATTVASVGSEMPHNFLSNRSDIPRHSSISSVSSTGSISSVLDTPSSVAVDASPVVKQAFPTFLALNIKYAAPTGAVEAISPVSPSSFLSNKN